MSDGRINDAIFVEVLLCDYAEGRDDERYFGAMQGTAFTLALGALSLLGVLANAVASGQPIPSAILASTPLVVLAMLAFIQSAASQAVLRSFYLRALEREIRSRVGLRGDMASYPDLRPLSYIELMTSYTSLSAESSRLRLGFFRLMTGIVFFTLWLVFGGLVVYFALQTSPPWRIAMACIYIPGSLVIFLGAIVVNMRGRQFFSEYVSMTEDRISRPLTPKEKIPTVRQDRHGRSLLGYLLLPRPDDLGKVLYVALGAWVAWVAGNSVHSISELLVVIVAFEFLTYQSRYQWNDITGSGEDIRSPSAVERGRLPDVPVAVTASRAVIVVRLSVLLWVASLRWGSAERFTTTDAALLGGSLGVFLLAGAYEQCQGVEPVRGV